MRRSRIKKSQRPPGLYSLAGHESGSRPSGRKPLRKWQLSPVIIQGVIRAVTSELLSHQEVAAKFNVTAVLVHRLLKAHKKSPQFVEDMVAREAARSRKVSLTVAATEELLKTQYNLWRASQVVDVLKQKYDMHVSGAFVSNVLRNVMGMRYKRTVRVAIQTNSEASMTKRCASAQVLLT
jgi:transposase